ncbi:MAG: hypothetical protein R3B47_20075 [Bacteroidia bacterium]
MRQQLIGIFFLLLLVAPLPAIYLGLQMQKIQVRKAVKRAMIAGMEKEDLVLLVFSKEETSLLNWKHSHEFEYQGGMYDVVERGVRDGKVYFRCWEDHAETQLNRRLNQLTWLFVNQKTQNREQQKRLISFYTSLFCAEIKDWQGLETATFFQEKPAQPFPVFAAPQPPVPPPES